MAYNPRDHYFKKAKEEGYHARSAFKLEEIQKRHKIIKPNSKVLDLGSSPGSWSQYVLKIIGPKGFLRGIDLQPTKVNAANAVFMEADIFNIPLEEYAELPYDVVLSDMAPKTTGIAFRDKELSRELCEKVVLLSDELLRPGGNLVMKFFMGEGFKEMEKMVKDRFQKVQTVRPQSTRKTSSEVFIVGLGKKS